MTWVDYRRMMDHDALAAVCWLVATGCALCASWKWTSRLFPSDPCLERIGHATLLFWAGVVATATLLGLVDRVTGVGLVAMVLALSLGALLVLARMPHAPVAATPIDRAECGWLTLWGALFAYAIGHVVAAGLLTFPTDWDTLAYHLPLVDQWLQTRGLHATGCADWADPGNNELLTLWAVAPFSGDFLATLTNLIPAVLLATSTVSLATRFGLPRSLAHAAGFAAVCNFVVLKQLVDTENDVAVAAAFFAVLSYAFRIGEGPSGRLAFFAAVALGLLVGVKYYALGYAALALGVWLLLSLRAGSWRTAVGHGCCGVLGMLALGGYWYLRNLVMTGSPAYPLGIALTQIYPDVAHTSFVGNRSPQLLPLYLQAIWKMTGPIQLVAVVAAPTSFVWLAATALRSGMRGDRRQALARLACALTLAGTATLLCITPFAVEDRPGTLNQMHWHYCPVRYGLCFLGTATFAALVMLRDLALLCGQRLRVVGSLGCLALLATALFQVAYVDSRLAIDNALTVPIALNAAVGLLAIALIRAGWPRTGPVLIALLVVVTFAGAVACQRLSTRWHADFESFYDEAITAGCLKSLRTVRLDSQRLFVMQERCYPFLGSRRENVVFQPVYVPSADALLEFLDANAIDAVVVRPSKPTPGWGRFLWFDECKQLYPDRFQRILQSVGCATYEVQKTVATKDETLRP